MTIEEMKAVLIDQYGDYQEIKRSINEESPILDYKIQLVAAKLESFGVNLENITLKK